MFSFPTHLMSPSFLCVIRSLKRPTPYFPVNIVQQVEGVPFLLLPLESFLVDLITSPVLSLTLSCPLVLSPGVPGTSHRNGCADCTVSCSVFQAIMGSTARRRSMNAFLSPARMEEHALTSSTPTNVLAHEELKVNDWR